jgi:hypothetical protein
MQEASGQKEYCLYSKLFNLFKLDSYFRPAGLGKISDRLIN